MAGDTEIKNELKAMDTDVEYDKKEKRVFGNKSILIKTSPVLL